MGAVAEFENFEAEESGGVAGVHIDGVMEADDFDGAIVAGVGEEGGELLQLMVRHLAVSEAVSPKSASVGIKAEDTDFAAWGFNRRMKLDGVAASIVIAVWGLRFWTTAAP